MEMQCVISRATWMIMVHWHLHWALSKQWQGGWIPPESLPNTNACQHLGLYLNQASRGEVWMYNMLELLGTLFTEFNQFCTKVSLSKNLQKNHPLLIYWIINITGSSCLRFTDSVAFLQACLCNFSTHMLGNSIMAGNKPDKEISVTPNAFSK